MKKVIIIKKIFLILSFIIVATSCKEDAIIDDLTNTDNSGATLGPGEFALGFTVTLDDLGGDGKYNPMKEWESYIDPSKFRVLFFDSQERFLFESKSRWVKQSTSINSNSVWYVSVPFYSYGNDETYDWDFDKIRETLVSEDFKIALLVNRPLHEYSSDYSEKEVGSDGGSQNGWFDSNTPNWTKENSLFGYTDIKNLKRIFDLHHTQFDPVYVNKAFPTSGYSGTEGFYDFIMDGPIETDKNGHSSNSVLSSFKSWVDWDGEQTDKSNQVKINGGSYKRIVLPSEKDPIPMYGMQNFKRINAADWPEGSTFDLGRSVENGDEVTDLPISLLRCCVKVELVLPKPVEWCVLEYSNIYSRCEPINVWTPTNELWDNNHASGDECDDFKSILNYGAVARTTDDRTSPLLDYQKRISWFYGAWKEKGDEEVAQGRERCWNFGSLTSNGTNWKNFAEKATGFNYPQIYNPMIQRNETAVCYKKGVDHENLKLWHNTLTGNYHLIAYTGERNINDPSNLAQLNGSGSHTSVPIFFWLLKFEGETKLYIIPITDYSKTNNPALNLATVADDENQEIKNIQGIKGAASENTLTDNINYYATEIAKQNTNAYPWPLIRNHVYRIYLKGTRGDGGMMISSEQTCSKSISFPDAIVKKNRFPGNNTGKPATLDTSTIKK